MKDVIKGFIIVFLMIQGIALCLMQICVSLDRVFNNLVVYAIACVLTIAIVRWFMYEDSK